MTDELELSADGVSVRKWIDTDDFPVPAVSFELSSEREEPVVVRLIDAIPESFSMDRVGFHPEYESENWTAYPDQRVGFERELEAGESVRTVYGVRLEDDSGTDRFMGEPDLEVLAPGDADAGDDDEGLGDATMADIAPPERTEVVRDVIEGERETVPGLDDGEEGESPEEILEDIGEPIDEDATPEAGAGDDEADAGGAAGEEESADGETAEEDVLGEPADDEGEEDVLAEEPADDTDEGEDVLAEEPADDTADEEPADEAAAGDEELLDDEGEEPLAESPLGDDGAEPADAAAGEETEGDAAPAGGEEGAATADTGPPGASPGNVAAALAAEIESGQVEEETLEQLRSALGGVPNSVETRVS
ncbi:MAG: hypothetical protein ABEH77_04955, partial [Halobacteriaceae archaeon]